MIKTMNAAKRLCCTVCSASRSTGALARAVSVYRTELSTRLISTGSCSSLTHDSKHRPRLWDAASSLTSSGSGAGKSSWSNCGLSDARLFSTKHEKAKDLYAIIGVSPNATQKQIKDAYYKLSMRYHPDRNLGNPEAHQKITELNEAYAVLGQYDQRRRYDKGLLHQYPRRPHPHHRESKPHQKATVYGDKVKFDFDAFYRAHYGEALRRDQRVKREKQAAKERAELKTVSDTTQSIMIIGVSTLVFLVGWYFATHRRTKNDGRIVEIDNN